MDTKENRNLRTLETGEAEFTDPDATLRADPSEVRAPSDEINGNGDARQRRENERRAARERTEKNDLTPDERLERLEALAVQYFGTHHFETAPSQYDPEVERQNARVTFEREMRKIEERARQPQGVQTPHQH